MKLGLFMMPMHPPGKPHALSYDQDLETLIKVDELGFDEAWIGEHFTSAWENIPAPDLMIAAALQRTKTIRLGTGVNCLPNHNPVVLAHRIAQLDQMAKGRFNWGIGSGGFPGDFELFRIDLTNGEQRTITRDSVDLVLKVWEEAIAETDNGVDGSDRLVSETDRWKFKLPQPTDWGLRVHMVPFQRPHPPIAVAGLTVHSETLVMAGERGWIPMSINFVPAVTLTSHWEAVQTGAQRGGRTAQRSEWRIARDVYVAETDEQARRDVKGGAQAQVFEEYFFPLVRSQKQMYLFKSDPATLDETITVDWLMDNIWLVGSPETVAGKIRALHTEVGGFGGILPLTYDWGDQQDKNYRSMELMAKKVIPQVADLR